MNFIPDSSLVIVVGAQRSGSTLFRILLDQHPSISNPGEFDFLFDGTFRGQSAALTAEYRTRLLHERIFLAKKLVLKEMPDIDAQIRDMVAQVDRPDITLAMNIHRNFARALEVFPDARFVHLVRDPRDVARSSIGMGWAGNVYYGVDHWIRSERAIDRLKQDLAEGQYFEIRYESLVGDPEATLGSVCEFLNLPYDKGMLDFPEDSTYGPPDPSFSGQWKRKLSAREIQLVESKVGEMLEERGYSASVFPEHRPSLLECLQLWLSNRWKKNLFAQRRYGFSLWAQEKIFRVIGMRLRWVRCRLEMNNVDEKYLR